MKSPAMPTGKKKTLHSPHAAVPDTPKRLRSVPTPGEDAQVPEETLSEAESELGMNDWIDPETGEPAEGQSPPHLEEE
jgi:hypothetical protein